MVIYCYKMQNEVLFMNNGNTSKRTAKRKLIIIIMAIAVVMLILIGAVLIINMIEANEKSDEKYEEETVEYDFYPANFEENILEDSDYAKYISEGFIKYADSNTGLTEGIDNNSSKTYSASTQLMVDLIYDIIEGDYKSYNEYFNEEYYKHREPKQAFTMQRLYDVRLTYMGEEKSEDDNYTKFLYCLEYRIDKNNGTFRKDIGDGSKKQYFTLVSSSGTIKIKSVSTATLG